MTAQQTDCQIWGEKMCKLATLICGLRGKLLIAKSEITQISLRREGRQNSKQCC